MTTAVIHGTLSASEHSAQLRKAIIASTIGTAIEWYDFFLYGTAAGLIFGKLYFPNSDPLTATLAAFGTYFMNPDNKSIAAAGITKRIIAAPRGSRQGVQPHRLKLAHWRLREAGHVRFGSLADMPFRAKIQLGPLLSKSGHWAAHQCQHFVAEI